MLVAVNYDRKYNCIWEVLDINNNYKVIAKFKTMKEAQQYAKTK